MAKMFEVGLDFSHIRALSGADAPLVCGIWIVSEAGRFPETYWHDFVGSVIGSASHAIEEILHGASEAYFYFFDGPFFVRLESASENAFEVYVEVCERDKEGEDILFGRFTLLELAQSFRFAVECLQNVCLEVRIAGLGVELLQKSKLRLDSVIDKLP